MYSAIDTLSTPDKLPLSTTDGQIGWGGFEQVVISSGARNRTARKSNVIMVFPDFSLRSK
jgi:hypothetical protein